MKIFILLGLLFGLIFPKAHSQGTSGYVVTTKGDSLVGAVEVSFQRHQMNTLSITKNNKVQEFSNEEVKAFYYNKNRYIKAIVQVSDRVNNALTVKTSSKLTLRTDTVFVKEIYKSSKSLYTYRDQHDNDHFFLGIKEQLMYLLYDKYITEKEGKEVWVEDNKFIGQLTVHFGDCEDLMFEISRTKYNETSLLSIFDAYTKCKKEVVQTIIERKKAAVLIGLQFQGTTLSDNYSAVYRNKEHSLGGFVAPNIGFLKFGSGLRKNSFIRIESSYSYINETFKYESGNPSAKVVNSLQYKLHFAQLQGTVGYCLGNGKNRFFMTCGLGYYYAVSQRVKFTKESYNGYNLVNTTSITEETKTFRAKLGAPIGLGVIGNSFMCELRYDGFSQESRIKDRVMVRRIALVCNFLF